MKLTVNSENRCSLFGKPTRRFTVVGYGNSIEREYAIEECGHLRIPILRRISEGDTVLLGLGQPHVQ